MTASESPRIATCGGVPAGTPGAVVAGRRWEDYQLGRSTTERHLEALDAVYGGVIADHRRALEELGDLDGVSQDLMVGHLAQLELFAWFIRSHLEWVRAQRERSDGPGTACRDRRARRMGRGGRRRLHAVTGDHPD